MNAKQKAVAYAENARLRNTPCYCHECKLKDEAELLASVQQITKNWPMPAVVLKFGSQR